MLIYNGPGVSPMTGPVKSNYKVPSEVSTKFAHRVLIKNHSTYNDLQAWCRNNVESNYQWDHTWFQGKYDSKVYRLFSFAKPVDAMAFKLEWS